MNKYQASLAAALIAHTKIPIVRVAQEVGVSHPHLGYWYTKQYETGFRKVRKKTCYRNSKLGDKNPMHGKRGAEHHYYKGEVSDGKGYLLILKPTWFTGKPGSKHIFVHHKNYCEANGLTEIPDGYVIHHKDGVKTNNDIGNLELMTKSEHSTHHQEELRNLQNTTSKEE